jgi:hypothetical protein
MRKACRFVIILTTKKESYRILHPVTDEGLVTRENFSNVASKNGLFDHRIDEG